jgi:four helix bundle protein
MSKEKIEKFEDLIAWQKAKELTKDIYKVTRQGEFLKDFGLRDQAEGFERGGRSEFHQFLVIA